MLIDAQKGGKCQMWSKGGSGITSSTGEKEKTCIEGMMMSIGVGGETETGEKEETCIEGMMMSIGVGGDTETMRDFGVGQQEGLGTIKIGTRDGHE